MDHGLLDVRSSSASLAPPCGCGLRRLRPAYRKHRCRRRRLLLVTSTSANPIATRSSPTRFSKSAGGSGTGAVEQRLPDFTVLFLDEPGQPRRVATQPRTKHAAAVLNEARRIAACLISPDFGQNPRGHCRRWRATLCAYQATLERALRDFGVVQRLLIRGVFQDPFCRVRKGQAVSFLIELGPLVFLLRLCGVRNGRPVGSCTASPHARPVWQSGSRILPSLMACRRLFNEKALAIIVDTGALRRLPPPEADTETRFYYIHSSDGKRWSWHSSTSVTSLRFRAVTQRSDQTPSPCVRVGLRSDLISVF